MHSTPPTLEWLLLLVLKYDSKLPYYYTDKLTRCHALSQVNISSKARSVLMIKTVPTQYPGIDLSLLDADGRGMSRILENG